MNRIKSITLITVFLISFTTLYSEKTLKFAVVEWTPYTSEQLKDYGYHADITKEALKAVGYNVEFSFYPWARCINMVQTGKADGITTIYYTDERNQFAAFTDPVTTATAGLFKLKGSSVPDTFNKLTDIKNYTFGVTRNYAHTEEFDNANYLKKDFSNSDEENIKKFINKRFQILAAGSTENILYIIQKLYPAYKDKLKLMKPVLSQKEVMNAFSRKVTGYQKYVNDFNKGLKMIKDNGTYDRILKKHGIN